MRDPIPSRAGRRRGPTMSVAILALLVSQAHGGEGMAVAPPTLGMAVGPPGPGMVEAGPPPSPSAPRKASVQEPAPVIVLPPPRRPRTFGGVAAGPDGPLPNQRTGRHHEHVVRDICIGC